MKTQNARGLDYLISGLTQCDSSLDSDLQK